jgi:stearoyl-CoA desaturase (delta-9 desaturase)
MFTTRPFRAKVVQDLLADPVLAFQHRYYEPCLLAVNVLIFGAVSWWTGDPLGTLVLAVLLRLFLNHHPPWFINSLAHLWGTQPYSKEHSAVNNLILAFLTWGEGYHNYHHTFSGDYRNGVYWYQFDPTKWLIWFGSKIGLTRGLRRVSRPTILRRLVGQDLRLLLDHLRGTDRADLAGLEERIRAQASRLQAKLGELKGVLSRASCGDRRPPRSVLALHSSTYCEYASVIHRCVRSDLTDAFQNLLARSRIMQATPHRDRTAFSNKVGIRPLGSYFRFSSA